MLTPAHSELARQPSYAETATELRDDEVLWPAIDEISAQEHR